MELKLSHRDASRLELARAALSQDATFLRQLHGKALLAWLDALECRQIVEEGKRRSGAAASRDDFVFAAYDGDFFLDAALTWRIAARSAPSISSPTTSLRGLPMRDAYYILQEK